MILDPTGTAPTRVLSHSARNSALTLLAALTVASFTALVMFRATPVRVHATTRPVEHQLPDGVVLRLEPGSSAQIVRDFSLWWGEQAKPRLITVHRGRGVIASAEGARPFVVETRDAQVHLDGSVVEIDATEAGRTTLRVERGRALVNAKQVGSGALQSFDSMQGTKSTVLAGEGDRIIATGGELETVTSTSSL